MQQKITKWLHSKVRGPRSKLWKIRNMRFQLDLKIIVPAETWQPSDIVDGEVKLQSTTLFRYSRLHKTGSGVTIYINSHFKAATPNSNE